MIHVEQEVNRYIEEAKEIGISFSQEQLDYIQSQLKRGVEKKDIKIGLDVFFNVRWV